MIPVVLIVIVGVGSYKSDTGLGRNSMKPVFRTISATTLLLTSIVYTSAQAGFVYENGLADNSTAATAYNIDSHFGTTEPLFGFLDGTPFIQDSSGNNISSSPHVQIVSDEAGRTATKDYFSFNANAGSLLTLDVDCAYIVTFSSGTNPCNSVIVSGLVSVVDTVFQLWDPDGNLAASNDEGGIPFTIDGTPSQDYGTSNATDSFLEYSLFMSGLWIIELGQFGEFQNGVATIDAFDTNQAYLLNVTLVSAIPVPAALWLFGTALIGLIGVGRRKVQG